MSFAGGKTETLKSLLNELIESKGWTEKLEEHKFPQVWSEAAGLQAANVTKVGRFKDGDLIIITESSTWRSELKLRSSALIEKMNEIIGKEIVKSIKFR